MSISEAIQAFLFAKEIQGLSPNTLRIYCLTLARFQAFFEGEDPALQNITTKDILAFLHMLRTKTPVSSSTIPQRRKPLSPKSIRNVHATLSSLWEWAIEERLVQKNVVRVVKPPNPALPTIKPVYINPPINRDMLKTLNTLNIREFCENCLIKLSK